MAASPELLKLWAETEALLRTAVEGIAVREDPRALVLEFLDHNELGLAAELLREAVQSGALASSQALDALASAEAKCGLGQPL